ncbi:MAG: FtsX-like permease family protein, partial [Terriglobales bacterium]
SPRAARPEGARTGGGGPGRGGRVVAQVAFTLTLLAVAALFTQGLIRARRAPLGFDPQQVQTWTMDPQQIGASPAQGLELYRQLTERVRALPQVTSAALSSTVPLSDTGSNDYLKIGRYANPPGKGMPLVAYSVVSTGYFETLRIPMVQGRAFRDTDRAGTTPVAIVNQAFAAQYWPGLNPIGQHFAKVSGITNPNYEVVGVARDSRTGTLSGPMPAYFYLPLEQNYLLATAETLSVRSAANPAVLQHEVEATVRRLAPALPVYDVGSLEAELESPNGWLLYQFGAVLAVMLAGVGLLLAGLGVYGVVAHSAAQRTHEIAVRMALGAEPRAILGLLLRQGLAVAGIGIALGWLGAVAAARWSASLLSGVGDSDPATLAGVSAFLLAVALAACYLPARKVLRTDPARALRQE